MDALMRRTAARPLPAGLLQPRDVLIFGVDYDRRRSGVARARRQPAFLRARARNQRALSRALHAA